MAVASEAHEYEPELDEILLFRVDPAINMDRFYLMSVQPDLFGGMRLVREWGRRGTRGRSLATHHPDAGSAIAALIVMHKRKLRRGYCPAI